MIPPKTAPCWKALLTGQTPAKFKMAALAMCVARNQRQALQDPASLDKCVDEVHLFCTKFERLVEQELNVVFDLTRV